MAQLCLSVLKTFQATLAGTPIVGFRSTKTQALLIYLAVEIDRPHRREVLAGLLWPDHPERAAQHNLSQSLLNLRQVLGDAISRPSFFLPTRQTIQFNPASDHWLDIAELTAHLNASQAHAHADPSRCAFCMHQLAEVIDLYRAPFLAEFSLTGSDLFEEWALLKREWLHRQVVAALNRLIDDGERQGDQVATERYARRLVELDPFRESAHRQLMRALALGGQRGAALAQYESCRRLLATELDAAPAAETTALYEHIRDRDTRTQADGHTLSLSPALLVSPTERQFWAAPDLGSFYGRTAELVLLRRWLVADRCRVVMILGMGGVGKTALAATLAGSIRDCFERVIWRSLINAPPLEELLRECIQALAAEHEARLPASLDARLDLLLAQLRRQRCLLVLDNVESILQTGERAGGYRPGYDDYRQLLAHVAQSEHASCLLLTSRERPSGLERLEGPALLVQALQLAGVDSEAGRSILREHGLNDRVVGYAALVERYSGNPLALKLVAATIRDLFAGNVAAFLHDETPIFDNIRDMLDQQFARLSSLEHELLVWLAIEREPVTFQSLQADLVRREPQRAVLEALGSLQRRSLLEQHGDGCTLQNVVMEYTTDVLVTQVVRELEADQLELFVRHALMKARAKEYVRQSQIRLILAPVAERLEARLGWASLVAKLRALPDALRRHPELASSYAAGNVLNLLIHIGADLRGLDLARLAVWQADLRGARTPDLNIAHADLREVAFTENMRAITCVAFSPDGQLFAAGAIDGKVFLWHFAERRLIRTYTGHTALVNVVVFSPHGAILASGAADETIRLWDLAGETDAHVIQAHAGGVIALDFSSRGMLASAGYDGAIRMWDAATAKLRHTLQERAPLTLGVAWSPDGSTLVSGGYDCTVHLWDATTGASLGALQGHSDIVPHVVYSHDGSLIASGSSDRTIRVWDARTGLPLHVFEGHTNVVTALAFSPVSTLLASGAWDQTVRLWDLSTGRFVALLAGHTSHVSSLVFSPDGATLVTGGFDQTIRLWDVHTHQLLTMLRGHTSWVWALAFSPDGGTLASAHHDQVVRLWDTSSRAIRATLDGHTHEVTAVAISPDGTTLASAGNDRKVRLWDVGTGQIVRVFAGHTAAVYQVNYSPDGHQLASGDLDGTVWIWDLHDDRHHCVHHGQRHSAAPVAWGRQPGSGDLLLATPTDEFGIQLWDARTGQPLRLFRGHSAIVTALALSTHAAMLISGSWDLTVRLWDVATGQLTRVLRGHTNYVMATALSPDETLVASGSLDGTVRLWDRDAGTERHKLLGHAGGVFAVVFSPDGTTVASGSDDETIRLWEVQSGVCLRVFCAPGPYAGMNITGAAGLTPAQRQALIILGAIEQ